MTSARVVVRHQSPLLATMMMATIYNFPRIDVTLGRTEKSPPKVKWMLYGVYTIEI